MADFIMFAGDTKILEVTVKDTAGAAVDITGTVIRWQLAKSVRALVPLIEKSVGDGLEIVDGPTGRFDVTVDPDNTLELKGNYYHEAEVDDGGIISTVMTGKATITPALIKPEGS
jgi:hypothetical protein